MLRSFRSAIPHSRAFSSIMYDSGNIIRFEEPDGSEHFGVLSSTNRRVAYLVKPTGYGKWEPTNMMKDVHRVLPPLEPIAIYGIGLNYAKHAQETNLDLPKFPVYFMKSPDSVTGHEQPIVIPRVAASPPEVDYEGELAVVIGKPCKNATAAEVGIRPLCLAVLSAT